ncbi:major facilitator superfamily-domain-containing protein [Dipodascopsis uninucleata]
MGIRTGEISDKEITAGTSPLTSKQSNNKSVKDLSQLESIHPELRPLVFKSTLHEVICIIVLTLGPCMNAMNQGGLNLALPHVSEYFHIDGSQLSWTINSYSLVTGSTILVMARLSDILGRKRSLVCAFGFYALMSLIQGFMHNAVAFDTLRGIQALGGAAGPTAGAGMIGLFYRPGKRRNRAMACFAAGAPVGFVFGITVSGICTQFISWKAFVFFLAIIYGIFSVIAYFTLPSDELSLKIANAISRAIGGKEMPVNRDWRTSLKLVAQIDYIGAALSIVGIGLFVFALSGSSGASDGWKTPYIIVLLIVGIVIIALFVVWENYAKDPIMPMFIWKYPGFALCMTIVFCGWLNFQGSLSYFVSLDFQNIKKYSAIHTTAAMLPMSVSGVLVNVCAAYILHIIPGQILMIIGMCTFTIAALLWALQPLHITYWAMCFPALTIGVVGADLSYNVGNQYALSAVPPHLKSTAAGIFNVMTQISSSVGIAASTAIVTSQIGSNIESQSPEILHRGYKYAYWFGVGISGLGIILSFFLKIGTSGGHGLKSYLNEKPAAESQLAADANPVAENTTVHGSTDFEKSINNELQINSLSQ